MFQDMHPTPDISHITREDYKDVYEPSEDSFLFMDALENDVNLIKKLKPLVCVEVGSGSGVLSCFLATLLQDPCMYWMTDINAKASQVSVKTMAKNNITTTDAITTDITAALVHRLVGTVDILLCNPPYVPTPPQEVGLNGIAASWAGGAKGREVIDQLLPSVNKLLSPQGLFYLLCIRENDPDEIISALKENMVGEVILQRRANNEHLMVLRFTRNHGNQGPAQTGYNNKGNSTTATPTL